jgi:hypothetical protein
MDGATLNSAKDTVEALKVETSFSSLHAIKEDTTLTALIV